ncbi:unnamed protein product, partial [Porites evermanni]
LGVALKGQPNNKLGLKAASCLIRSRYHQQTHFAPSKNQRSVYDYIRGDFDDLRSSLRAANLANFVSNDDANINVDWHNWKDALLAAVKDHIPKKKLKGRYPVPWINGPIINFKKRKRNPRYFVSVFTQDADICRPDCVDEVHPNPELCDLTFTTNQVQLFV